MSTRLHDIVWCYTHPTDYPCVLWVLLDLSNIIQADATAACGCLAVSIVAWKCNNTKSKHCTGTHGPIPGLIQLTRRHSWASRSPLCRNRYPLCGSELRRWSTEYQLSLPGSCTGSTMLGWKYKAGVGIEAPSQANDDPIDGSCRQTKHHCMCRMCVRPTSSGVRKLRSCSGVACAGEARVHVACLAGISWRWIALPRKCRMPQLPGGTREKIQRNVPLVATPTKLFCHPKLPFYTNLPVHTNPTIIYTNPTKHIFYTNLTASKLFGAVRFMYTVRFVQIT